MIVRWVLLAVVCVMPSSVLARTWVDDTGRFSVEAELVASRGDHVVLRKTDGATLTVPLSRLSEADRELLRASAEMPWNNDARSDNDDEAQLPASLSPATLSPVPDPPPPNAPSPKAPSPNSSPSSSPELDSPPLGSADGQSSANSAPDRRTTTSDTTTSDTTTSDTSTSDAVTGQHPAAQVGQANSPEPTPLESSPTPSASANKPANASAVASPTAWSEWSQADLIRGGVLLVLAIGVYGFGPAILLTVLAGGISGLILYNSDSPLPLTILLCLAASYCLPIALVILGNRPQALFGSALVLGLPALLVSHFAGGTTWAWAALDATLAGVLLPCALARIVARGEKVPEVKAPTTSTPSYTPPPSRSSYSAPSYSNYSNGLDYPAFSDSPRPMGRSELRSS